ncbi:UDP-glucuronosyltransferase [Sergentomyia squamirostris]
MKDMDFITKLKTFIYSAFGKITSNLLNEKSEKYYKSIFPYPKYRPYDEIRKNISLFFINEHVSVDTARALVPNVIPVGGLNIKSNPDPLPQNIQNFMDNAQHGVIYLSFGTTLVHPSHLNQITIESFSKIKQKVLIKWNSEVQPYKSENIMWKKWFPQEDILAHKNIRVFITHGGIKGITEARYHAVPIIGIPMFYDQFTNIDTAVKEGWGLLLRLKDLNEESLLIALSEVLNNPKYKEAALKMSSLYRDRPKSAMDTAIYWTEYVIRHHGAPHLQSPAVHLNFWERNSLDVIAFLVVILVVIVKLLIFSLKFCCNNMILKLFAVNTKSKEA